MLVFVNHLNGTNIKSNKTQFQFQFELSLAQPNEGFKRYKVDFGKLSHKIVIFCTYGWLNHAFARKFALVFQGR